MVSHKSSLVFALSVSAALLLLSCSRPKDEISGVLNRSPSYDSSTPHQHKFGKLLLVGTNGQTYALREGKGFHVLDTSGNRLSEPGGQYPIEFDSNYRVVGRTIELSEAQRLLKTEDKPSDLWYPKEATTLFDVELMILTKAP